MRGAGSNQTVLQLNFTNTTASGVLVGGFSWSGTVRSNLADFLVGATNLNGLTNLTSITAGTMIWLQENDASSNNVYSPGPTHGSADPVHYNNPHNTKAAAAAPLVRQGFIVQSVSGSNLVVWPPSNFNFHSNYSKVQVAQTFSCRYFGIEDLSIKNMAGGLGTNINKIVEVNQAAYFWMKGVSTENAAFAHVHPSYTIGAEITGSRFSGAPVVGPSAGVGIHFASHNNNALVYNNVFDNSYPAIEYYLGTSGMATLYNAAVNARGGLPAFDFHNAHHELNLFEGNVANGIIQDGYFGSARWITLHRNWFHGTPSDGGFRRTIDICRYGREWNIVNNVLGESQVSWKYDGTFTNGWSGGLACIYRLGHPEMGSTTWTGTNSTIYATTTAALDLWTHTNLIRHLNYDYAQLAVTNHDATITNTTSPTSYFASWNSPTKPTWYSNAAWPPIGSELTTKTNGNPAYNYYYGITYSDTAGGGEGYEQDEPAGRGDGGSVPGFWTPAYDINRRVLKFSTIDG